MRQGARASTNVAVSPDGRRATRTKGAGWNAACISEASCDAVTVRVVASQRGFIMLGFIHPDDFAVDGPIFDKPRAYMLFCYNGSLVGSGKDNSSGTAYHKQRIPAGSTVRCVRDRKARTVAFTIDGHCPGVAFADVPDGDLFFACQFVTVNDCVEFVD